MVRSQPPTSPKTHGDPKGESPQVNANGETYPVGFMIANWAASYAANLLAATLVEAGSNSQNRLRSVRGLQSDGPIKKRKKQKRQV